jgi:very-short-patch-repair endonuclease
MATTTNGITTKLREKFADEFLMVARDLRRSGYTNWEIMRTFNAYIENKQRSFCKRYKQFTSIGAVGQRLIEEHQAKADSKIETIYFKLFEQHGIKFKFQYKISAFRADFLINGWFVFEIDGPDHDKGKDGIRDAHMRQLGYEVFRVPAWLAASCPSAVIENIKELIN